MATKAENQIFILPRETKMGIDSLKIPSQAASGPLTVSAKLNFQLLVRPVADFLGVPEKESRVVEINKPRIAQKINPQEFIKGYLRLLSFSSMGRLSTIWLLRFSSAQ